MGMVPWMCAGLPPRVGMFTPGPKGPGVYFFSLGNSSSSFLTAADLVRIGRKLARQLSKSAR